MKGLLIIVGIAAMALLTTAATTQAQSAGAQDIVQLYAANGLTDAGRLQVKDPLGGGSVPSVPEPDAGDPPRIYSPLALLAILAAIALLTLAVVILIRKGLREGSRSGRRRRRARLA
jgi:hypothetical protein